MDKNKDKNANIIASAIAGAANVDENKDIDNSFDDFTISGVDKNTKK